MGKVYVLIDNGWDTIGESYAETERCIGVFTSPESVTKAANDYLAHRLNTIGDFEKEYFKIPEVPITFEQLCGDEPYSYFNHTDYYGSNLYVYEYELDKL